MKITKSNIFKEVKIFTSNVYVDDRGFFTETFNSVIKNELNVDFLQDNHSKSKKNVLRGIHYQWDEPMGKLCRVVSGSGFDFVIDLRVESITFGKYDFIFLSEENFKQVWVPPGFGHAFLSLEDNTQLLYKCTSLFNPNSDGSISPLDDNLNIDWPVRSELLILSEKDKKSQSFSDYKKNPKFI